MPVSRIVLGCFAITFKYSFLAGEVHRYSSRTLPMKPLKSSVRFKHYFYPINCKSHRWICLKLPPILSLYFGYFSCFQKYFIINFLSIKINIGLPILFISLQPKRKKKHNTVMTVCVIYVFEIPRIHFFQLFLLSFYFKII